MSIINHQSNGARGLRIAATTIICLGWVSFVALIFVALGSIAKGYFLLYAFYALLSIGSSYLTACLLRAIASLAEAAQLYYNINIYVDTPLLGEKAEEKE